MAELTNNMHVMELSAFQALIPTDLASDPDYLARRFLTLAASAPGDDLRGGSGYVTKVANCYGESFALKSMLEVRESDPQERFRIQAGRRQAFYEEYQAHRAVTGVPGIPQLYGLGTLAGKPVMLMDWVEGQTLAKARPLLPVAEDGRGHPGGLVAGIGLAVVRTLLLARGHAPGFVHRDVSARNIMLRGTAEVIRQMAGEQDVSACLIDMGSSAISQADRTSFTMGSDIWRYGTPEYAAPEMLVRDADIGGMRASASIDVYALCSVLYELYAGYAPYNMQDNRQALKMDAYNMKRQFAPISIALHDIADRDLVELIMAGIVSEQERRIGLEELYEGLLSYLGIPGVSARQLLETGAQVGRPVPGQLDPLDAERGGGRLNGPLPERLTRTMDAPPGRLRRGLRELFG